MEEGKLSNFFEAGEAERESITERAYEEAAIEMDKIRAAMQERGFAIEDGDGVPVFTEGWNHTTFIGMEWAGLVFNMEEFDQGLAVSYACPICHAAIYIGFATPGYFGLALMELHRQEEAGVITYGGHRCHVDQVTPITESLRTRLKNAYEEELIGARNSVNAARVSDTAQMVVFCEAKVAEVKARQLERLALLDAINHIEL